MKTNIRKNRIPVLTEITNSVFAYKLMTVPATKEQHKAKKYRLSSLTVQLILSEWLSLLMTISPSLMKPSDSFFVIRVPWEYNFDLEKVNPLLIFVIRAFKFKSWDSIFDLMVLISLTFLSVIIKVLLSSFHFMALLLKVIRLIDRTVVYFVPGVIIR